MEERRSSHKLDIWLD